VKEKQNWAIYRGSFATRNRIQQAHEADAIRFTLINPRGSIELDED